MKRSFPFRSSYDLVDEISHSKILRSLLDDLFVPISYARRPSNPKTKTKSRRRRANRVSDRIGPSVSRSKGNVLRVRTRSKLPIEPRFVLVEHLSAFDFLSARIVSTDSFVDASSSTRPFASFVLAHASLVSLAKRKSSSRDDDARLTRARLARGSLSFSRRRNVGLVFRPQGSTCTSILSVGRTDVRKTRTLEFPLGLRRGASKRLDPIDTCILSLSRLERASVVDQGTRERWNGVHASSAWDF